MATKNPPRRAIPRPVCPSIVTASPETPSETVVLGMVDDRSAEFVPARDPKYHIPITRDLLDKRIDEQQQVLFDVRAIADPIGTAMEYRPDLESHQMRHLTELVSEKLVCNALALATQLGSPDADEWDEEERVGLRP